MVIEEGRKIKVDNNSVEIGYSEKQIIAHLAQFGIQPFSAISSTSIILVKNYNTVNCIEIS